MAKRKAARRGGQGSRQKRRAPARVKNARAALLAIIGRERDVFNRKTQEYERRPPTQAQVARKIGVSVRTIQRWKNEGVTPRTRTRQDRTRLERLKREAQHAEQATAAESRRDRKRHPGRLRITKKDLPVLPVGHRRQLKRYAREPGGNVKATGETYDSSIVNYVVQGWNFREVAALVLKAWKAGKPFQFIYEVPAGGSLPKSGRSPERRVSKTTRAGTAPVNPFDFPDEASVLQFLNRYIDIERGMYSRHMVYVAIDDNFPEGEDEGEDE